MSSIPNNAMPHAGPATEDEGETQTLSQRGSDLKERATEQAGRIADLARENPRTAIAAGAALVAGVVAAAAIPLVQGARRKSANSSGSDAASKSGKRGRKN
jgi:hypothetical protein